MPAELQGAYEQPMRNHRIRIGKDGTIHRDGGSASSLPRPPSNRNRVRTIIAGGIVGLVLAIRTADHVVSRLFMLCHHPPYTKAQLGTLLRDCNVLEVIYFISMIALFVAVGLLVEKPLCSLISRLTD